MKYITKKRWKLAISFIIIPGVIFMISFFVHNIMVYPYVKTQTELLSRHFKNEIYEKIKNRKLYVADDESSELTLEQIKSLPELTDEQIKVLWDITDINSLVNIPVAPLMNYIRVFYIIACTICSIISLICMKWYMSNGDNLFISDEPKSKK